MTGLPYSYDFEKGSLDQYRNNGWTTNGSLRVSNETLAGRTSTLVLQHRRYSKGVLGLGKFDENEKGYIVSPKFHVPESINIQPCIERSVYNAGGDITRTGFVGTVNATNSTNKASITYTTASSRSTSGDVIGKSTWMSSFTISSSSSYISIDCDTRNDNDLGCYYFLHKAHFRYAQ